MDCRDHIASDANIMLGKPVVKGRRITVALVLKKSSEGASSEDLILAYPGLTPLDIRAVLLMPPV